MSEASLTTEQLQLLRIIAFSGAVESPRDIIGFHGDVEATLEALAGRGLIETEGVIVLTSTGEETLEAWYAEDRAKLDEVQREQLHEEFRPLDRQLKSLSSDWQEADGKNDWDGRLEVIESLSGLHDATLEFLDLYGETLPRLREYRDRLTYAHDKVLDGETEYIVGTQVDSYHTVWFNLHEDLLRLLQRERESE